MLVYCRRIGTRRTRPPGVELLCSSYTWTISTHSHYGVADGNNGTLIKVLATPQTAQLRYLSIRPISNSREHVVFVLPTSRVTTPRQSRDPFSFGEHVPYLMWSLPAY